MKQATNLYEQIYSFYKNLIYRGVIRKDEYLPSVREVALARKINPNTVVKAYSLLINDGLITSINKKGYLVIYSNEDKKQQYLNQTINKLKLEGYTKQELIETILEEYKDD
ncbi:MAG: GntR family transcriptional regulator [Firmicutes bacterium]|nr:GntR family transcriptional regulator [Candidatus Alectryobacillus merdavium]